MEEATKWLRVQGKASAAKRADREAGEGAVAVVRNGNVAAMVEMRCETDFVAKSDEFVSLVDEIAARVCAEGTDAVSKFDEQVEKMLTTLKENISIGRVYRLEAGEGEVVDTYMHQQAGRGVNGVIIVVKGASEEVAHEIAVHAAFTKPLYLNREDVPQSEIDKERKTVEAALPKIIEGRMNGWFKDRVLTEQSYVKDEKQTIAQFLGSASITAFAQVVIGG
jgi:elongation factor Ts